MERPDDVIIRHIIHRPNSTDADSSIVLRVAKDENTAAHLQDSIDSFQDELVKLGRTGRTVTMTVAEFDDHNRKAARTPGRRSHVLAQKAEPVDRFPGVAIEMLRTKEGHLVGRLTNTPALPTSIDKELWNARDAATMMANLGTFYRSIYGRGSEGMRRDLLRENGVDPEGTFDLEDPAENALAIAGVFEDENTATILAQDDFAEMLKAAALTAPNTELYRDELIAPRGMLFFARAQDLSTVIKSSEAPIRAISWWTVATLEHTVVQIRFYVDGPELWRAMLAQDTPMPGAPFSDDEGIVGIEGMYRFVVPVESIDTAVDQDTGSLPTTAEFTHALGLVRSINAVAKSAHTRSALAGTESEKQRKIRRRKGLRQPRQVRVLSLVNPNYGRYEMDAATGHKLRSHWVRGHWRQQWYPSIQDHRTIWIDGFIRGDAELGTVAGRKIYVAKGTAA
jgi:hypothetical protein